MDGVSVVVPFLNEAEGIEKFCKTIDAFASKLRFPLEIVFINDGSTDDTATKIRIYSFEHISSVKLIELSKNFGSHAAIRAGLCNTIYNICTWLSCDLQEPLELVPLSYEKIVTDGYDAVYVEKKTVDVSKVERTFSRAYSWLMQKYAVKNYASGGTATIVFNKKIKDFLNDNIESNSSLMLQIIDAGYRCYTLSLDYGERVEGKSKWTLSKKIKLFIDSFVSFSFMPIRLVSIIGAVIFLIGLVIGICTIINRFINPDVPVGYSTLASIMALGFGITNISLGIIAEYLWRAYDAARKRPVFIISEIDILKEAEGKWLECKES